MVTGTRTRIISYIRTNGQARVKDLVDHLSIGRVAVHRHLKALVEAGKLTKAGEPPKVFYRLATPSAEDKRILESKINLLLDKYYAYVDPTGQFLTGIGGFTRWAASVHKASQIDSLLNRYVKDREDIGRFLTPQGWIDASDNLRRTFGLDMSLDGVYYLDFYSLPTFGKTRLGSLVLYAKQSENKPLIRQAADESKGVISRLIVKLDIDAVGYIPHSILRRIQFLKEFSQRLNLSLSQINLTKAYPGKIRVAQKTLGKLEERIKNARETIFVDMVGAEYNRVLLIDDAVGSGATFNETAKKLKQMGIAKRVYGFAVVGSLKGFEVIREV